MFLRKKICYIIFIGILISFISSCISFAYYSPQKNFTPIVTKKNDINVEAGIFSNHNFGGYNVSAAWANTNKSYFTFSGLFTKEKTDYSKGFNVFNSQKNANDTTTLLIKNKFYDVNFGYGYFTKYKKHFVAGINSAIGFSNINYTSSDFKNLTIPGQRNVSYEYLNISPYVGFNSTYFDLIFIGRWNANKYFKVTDDATVAKGTGYENEMKNIDRTDIYNFAQFGFQMSAGAKNLRLYTSYIIAIPFQNYGFNFSNSLSSAGIILLANSSEIKNFFTRKQK